MNLLLWIPILTGIIVALGGGSLLTLKLTRRNLSATGEQIQADTNLKEADADLKRAQAEGERLDNAKEMRDFYKERSDEAHRIMLETATKFAAAQEQWNLHDLKTLATIQEQKDIIADLTAKLLYGAEHYEECAVQLAEANATITAQGLEIASLKERVETLERNNPTT